MSFIYPGSPCTAYLGNGPHIFPNGAVHTYISYTLLKLEQQATHQSSWRQFSAPVPIQNHCNGRTVSIGGRTSQRSASHDSRFGQDDAILRKTNSVR